MSYDLMIFNKSAAPQTRNEFIQWYKKQTEWKEGHTYDDPSVSCKELNLWFLDMIKDFPPLNGPYSIGEQSDRVVDYAIGRDVIYAGFAWSMARPAYKAMVELAEKHQVGFFDVSSVNGDILTPVDGRLRHLGKGDRKKRWKF